MKIFFFILTLLASLCCEAQSNVYSLSIYATGTSYTELCSLILPFPPNHYKLTDRSWQEDANGFYVVDFSHRDAPGNAHRHSLEIEYGSKVFAIPLGPVSPKKVEATNVVFATKGSGDFGPLVTQCVMTLGGHPTTNNTLPTFQANWFQLSQINLEVIILNGDRFTQVQALLTQAYGAPDNGIRSHTPIGNARSLTYTPLQAGVVLALTGNSEQTILSVIGKPKL